MGAADEVADHIRASLLDLRRRLDASVARQIAQAVLDGATRALAELSVLDDASEDDPAELRQAGEGVSKH